MKSRENDSLLAPTPVLAPWTHYKNTYVSPPPIALLNRGPPPEVGLLGYSIAGGRRFGRGGVQISWSCVQRDSSRCE